MTWLDFTRLLSCRARVVIHIAIITTALHWSNCIIPGSYIWLYEIEGLLDDKNISRTFLLSQLSISLKNHFTTSKGVLYRRVWKGRGNIAEYEKEKTESKSEVRRRESVKGYGQRTREWRRVLKRGQNEGDWCIGRSDGEGIVKSEVKMRGGHWMGEVMKRGAC